MLDNFTIVSTAQAITATAVSTDSIDIQLPNRDLSAGKEFYMCAQWGTAATAAGAATVTFEIISADDAALTSGVVSHTTSATIGKATLVPGYRVALTMPMGTKSKRYVGMRYTVATGPLTAGTVTSFQELDQLAYTQYTDGIKAIAF